jgi:hypothetical protein
VIRRRRRAALGGAAATALGLAPLGLDVERLSGATPRTAAAAQEPALPGGLVLLADNALWLARRGGPARLAAGTGGWLQDPAWSPDGTLVSYTHVRFRPVPGGVPWPSGEVLGVRPDAPGAAPRALLGGGGAETLVSGSWAPDGRSLYAVRRRPVGATAVQSDLVQLTLGSGEVRVLPVPVEAVEAVAGPDGMLAVVGATGPAVTGLPELALVLQLADGTVRYVVSTAAEAGRPDLGYLALPRFSPEGARIAFAGGEGSDAVAPAAAVLSRLPRLWAAIGARPAKAHGPRGWPWIASLESGAVRQIPTGGHDDLAGIAWLPDGEHLLVLDASGLAVVEIATGALTRLPAAASGLPATALAYDPRRG